MIVCQCAAVSDRDILRAIDRGATTVKEIARRTGAARCCGCCRPEVEALLASRLQPAQSVTPSPEAVANPAF